MSTILTSKHWYFRVVRVLILVTLAWTAFKSIVHAQSSFTSEWPRTDFDTRSVELNEVFSGGPPKDGIPPIDLPKFVDVTQASDWLHTQEPVISLEIVGKAKAYPLQILIYHEIVNDEISGVPVSVTFCPLCNASIVFDRRAEGRIFDFGTTGRLRKSDLVMYDRQTESWWQQFTGTGIVGEMTNTRLTQIPSSIVSFDDFQSAHPDGLVLSRDTGHTRPYGRNPYQGYDRVGQTPFLFNDPIDPRLPAMERVLSITEQGQHTLYPYSTIEKRKIINDKIGNTPVVVFSEPGTFSALDQSSITKSRKIRSATAFERRLDDQTLTFELKGSEIRDMETGTRWNLFGQAKNGPLTGKRLRPLQSGVHFAFAWLAFNPDSRIYRND